VIKSHHFSAILPASQVVFTWDKQDFMNVVKNAVNTAQLTVVGELGVTFSPQGISLVILLAESHIALHFWPEEKKVTVDIHICDYQIDNLEKAKNLAKIITMEISNDEDLHRWKYFCMSD
jgi:S-adenosylmethionine decarboxylase